VKHVVVHVVSIDVVVEHVVCVDVTWVTVEDVQVVIVVESVDVVCASTTPTKSM
jgi:hypothetical protein